MGRTGGGAQTEHLPSQGSREGVLEEGVVWLLLKGHLSQCDNAFLYHQWIKELCPVDSWLDV